MLGQGVLRVPELDLPERELHRPLWEPPSLLAFLVQLV